MAKKAATRKKKAKKGDSEGQASNDLWQTMNDKLGTDKPLPYRMNGTYTVDSALEHPKFGLGYVIMSGPEKIEVAFQDQNRFLVQNRK